MIAPSSPPDSKSHIKRLTKITTSNSRASKRSSQLQPNHASDSMDGRPKRVWKACERCRMKKTKCDGESPCKRCRNDGEVCVSGNRKKAEFKPAPKGYAERLETSQQALKSTVLKLYTMVRNQETWDLGEPTLNDCGQPAIHDIVSKLGCIRDSPDLPTVFPEGPQDFADLRAQLEAAEEDREDTKLTDRSPVTSPALAHSSSESRSSSPSSHSTPESYDAPPPKITKRSKKESAFHAVSNSTPISTTFNYDLDTLYQGRQSFDTVSSLQSPLYSEYQTEMPMFNRNKSALNPWAAADDSMGPVPPLQMTAELLRLQQQSLMNMQYAALMNENHGGGRGGLALSSGTIQPEILDSMDGFYDNDQMALDSMFNDFME